MFKKKTAAMLVAEFVGAAVLTLSVISVRSSGIGYYSLFVALGAGLALAVLMFMFSSESGGQFNPALTIGLWTAGLWSKRKVKTLAAVAYIIVQLFGAWVAYELYFYFVHPHLVATQHWVARMMFAEAVGMFVFVLGWAVAAVRKYEGVALATTVGGAFAVGIMIASLGSNGVINPAVALGVRYWDIWSSSGWIYVAGPVIGSIVGVNLYYLLMDNGTSRVAKLVAKKK